MVSSIFVTGAGGFLGQRVVERLSREKNCRTVCLIRGNPPAGAPSHVRYVCGDLLDPKSYAADLNDCETILHMAAATGKCAPDEYFRVNRDGTAGLIDQARQSGAKRFLFVSSVAAKFRDQYRYFYAASKQAAEALVASSGLASTIVRPTIILGEDSPILNSLTKLAVLPVVPIFGDGQVPVQPIFVDDLADCLVALSALEKTFENDVLEIGGPEVLSMQDLVLRIRQTAGKTPAPVLHLPVRLIARAIGLLEPVLLPLLPFTAGQLASFSNAGIASAHPWVMERKAQMSNIGEILQSTVHAYASA